LHSIRFGSITLPHRKALKAGRGYNSDDRLAPLHLDCEIGIGKVIDTKIRAALDNQPVRSLGFPTPISTMPKGVVKSEYANSDIDIEKHFRLTTASSKMRYNWARLGNFSYATM